MACLPSAHSSSSSWAPHSALIRGQLQGGNAMDFDELLTSHVGAWGRGQLVVLLLASMGWATLAVAVLSMVFVTQTPAWSCTSATDAVCQQQHALQHTNPAALCGLRPEQFTWDNPHASLVSTFNLVCDDSWKVGWCNAVFFIGYAIGSSLFGWMADTHGRKAALLASSVATAGVTLLCAASTSLAWYLTGRVLQGLTCSGLPITAYVLATESVGPAYRGRAGTASQLVYHAGESALPLTALLLQDWRLLYVSVAACCVLTAALGLLVPESPRWQLLHGRQAAAAQTLSWLAHLNGRQLTPEAAEQLVGGLCTQQEQTAADSKPTGVKDSKQAATAAGTTAAGAAADGEQDQEDDTQLQQDCNETAALLRSVQSLQPQKAALQPDRCARLQQQLHQQQHRQRACHAQDVHRVDSVWMIFTDPLLAKLFWVSAWLCTVMAAAFFTANLATEELQGSLYVNFILTSMGELPATVIGAVAVDSIGRRPTIGTGLLLTGVACCVCSLLNPGFWSTALAALGKSTCSSAWSLGYIYAAELMPTSVRSAALAGSNQAARLGGAVAPFIVQAGDRLGHPKLPFALVGVLATLTALMTALLPETRGKAQPDTMADLRAMYGSSSSASGTSVGSSGDTRGCVSDGLDDGPILEEQGCTEGLVRRLLSRSSSSRSWVLRAVRSGDFSQQQQQREPVIQREGSELQAVVTDRPSLG